MDFLLWIKVVILGVVEGFTEFLPVSSTGHLIVVGQLLGFNDEKGKIFEIVIQTGAMLAIVWEYRVKFAGVLTRSHARPQSAAVRLESRDRVSCPRRCSASLFGKYIKAALFKPVPVAIAFIVGGLIILWAERRTHAITVQSVDDMTWNDALKVGFAQAFALIPGTSRSGATIIGGLLFGLSRRAATEFSFFLAVPTLIAAGAYDLFKNRALFDAGGHRHIRGRHGGVVRLRVSVRALAAALYRDPRFHAVRVVPHRVWLGRARHRLFRPGELAGLTCSCRPSSAHQASNCADSALRPRQAARAPAADRVAVAARVAVAFESFEYVVGFAIAGLALRRPPFRASGRRCGTGT